MALSIKNEEAERVVRELAVRRGLSLVTAITQAAQETLERDKAKTESPAGKQGLAAWLMDTARETAPLMNDPLQPKNSSTNFTMKRQACPNDCP